MTEALENVKQFGMPDDCRGWRQFLAERIHRRPGTLAPFLPCIIWAEEESRPCTCGSILHLVHGSSVADLARSAGYPASAFFDADICESSGRFIE
jgi:hypothetical protein